MDLHRTDFNSAGRACENFDYFVACDVYLQI